MEHTQGKLLAVVSETVTIHDADGGRIAMLTHLKGVHGMDGRRDADEVAANARRLVACWNACEGVPLDEVENLANIGGLNALTVEAGQAYADADALKAQRDELLAGLERAAASFEARCAFGDADDCRALIAKHKGAEHG